MSNARRTLAATDAGLAALAGWLVSAPAYADDGSTREQSSQGTGVAGAKNLPRAGDGSQKDRAEVGVILEVALLAGVGTGGFILAARRRAARG